MLTEGKIINLEVARYKKQFLAIPKPPKNTLIYSKRWRGWIWGFEVKGPYNMRAAFYHPKT